MTDVLSGAMQRQIAHWQVQRLSAERSSASRNHFNRPVPGTKLDRAKWHPNDHPAPLYIVYPCPLPSIFFLASRYFLAFLHMKTVHFGDSTLFIPLLHADWNWLHKDFFSMSYIRQFHCMTETFTYQADYALRISKGFINTPSIRRSLYVFYIIRDMIIEIVLVRCNNGA